MLLSTISGLPTYGSMRGAAATLPKRCSVLNWKAPGAPISERICFPSAMVLLITVPAPCQAEYWKRWR